MIKKISAAAVAAALIFTGCGTISPPVQSETTSEVVSTEIAKSETESVSSDDKANTFAAEFFESNITFEDAGTLAKEVLKSTDFDTETDNSGGSQKVTLKGKNGGGEIDVVMIDISDLGFSYEPEYILENLGDYYFDYTASRMDGITEDDFVSSYRMVSSIMSKGKYQRYGSVQKSDGIAAQFGYTETYAVLSENKLTVVSGAYLSSDMMERQSFSQLMSKFAENVKY
ncbi:hypothetical protein [Ruminococcus sp. Marseille-P6503]|uniref:hypothetical protein n=1 Tax=Ruminococcus sp. Marseille-P6503 TaxID=2364796 RepID=UPI000F528452|nr:hypothetical protein [Ruminococcus sp. Marseille-P6503]